MAPSALPAWVSMIAINARFKQKSLYLHLSRMTNFNLNKDHRLTSSLLSRVAVCRDKQCNLNCKIYHAWNLILTK